MKEPFKIFFVAQDLGGFNAILPVVKELKKKKNFLLKLILADPSQDMAKKYKIRYQDGNCLTGKKLARLLKKERPDLIFTATSAGNSIEKRIIKAARIQKIKTLAIVDFWGNYRQCFSDQDTKNLRYLPDQILAIDEIMKKEMIDQGFNPEKIIITGNPFFDTFSKLYRDPKKKNLITFFCQPFSEIYKKEGKGCLGFDEIQVFGDLVEVLEKFKVPIKVRFHPRAEKLNKFDKIIKNSGLKISIEQKLSAEDLIKNSKLVVGMNSVVLFQAAMMGKPVLSYQPNLKKADSLISNRLGLSKAVYRKKDIHPALEKLLLAQFEKKDLRLIEKYTKNNSTKKVIDLIQGLR